MEEGVWAPSAGNTQSWEVIVVRNRQIRAKNADACNLREFIIECPVVLVICANKQMSGSVYGERGRELYSIQDAACAAQNMLLKIHELGLGACWIGEFDENAVSNLLEIPEDVRPVTLITVGYPDENPIPPPRDDVEEFIHYEKY